MENQAGPRTKQTLRLLSAEDSTTNQLVLKHLLKNMNIEIYTANNGRKAVQLYTQISPDLVIMDIMMPEMDGLEATTKIRAFESRHGLERCPIIALTANAMQGDRDVCLKSDMDDYLSKPIIKQLLVHMIEKWSSIEIGLADTALSQQDQSPQHSADEKTIIRVAGEESESSQLMDVGYLNDMKSKFQGDVFNTLVQQFCSDAENTLSALEHAFKQYDAVEIGKLLHLLKGCSANFGASALVELCDANTRRLKCLEDMTLADIVQLRQAYSGTKDCLVQAVG